jgi:hypothetical protein
MDINKRQKYNVLKKIILNFCSLATWDKDSQTRKPSVKITALLVFVCHFFFIKRTFLYDKLSWTEQQAELPELIEEGLILTSRRLHADILFYSQFPRYATYPTSQTDR